MTHAVWADRFICWLNLACLLGQGVVQLHFATRLLKQREKWWNYPLFLAAIWALDQALIRLRAPWELAAAAQLLALYGAGRLLLQGRPGTAGLAAVLGAYITQLSFGILNALQMILLSWWVVGGPLVYAAAVGASAAAIALCAALCGAVRRLLGPDTAGRAALLAPPLLFLSAAELYLLQTDYAQLIYSRDPRFLLAQAGRHTALLAMQLLGLAALFCTLYAWRGVCRGLENEAALSALRQAAEAQKAYLAEAAAREEKTRALRHDWQNHLVVLDGLLAAGRAGEGRAYLQKLHTRAAALAPPCHTGSPVADVLLSQKLGLAAAKGIQTEVSLTLPPACGLDELDLCAILANALDNAIEACQNAQEQKFLHVFGERQGNFLRIVFENTCPPGPPAPAGTGLGNIRAAAQKYRGSVCIEQAAGLFRLDLLLNISA